VVAAVGGCIVCVALIALLLCVVKKRGGDNGANTAEGGDLDEYRDVPSDIYGTAPNWRDDDDGLVEYGLAPKLGGDEVTYGNLDDIIYNTDGNLADVIYSSPQAEPIVYDSAV